MKPLRFLFLCAALALGPAATSAEKLGAGEKAALQAAMRQHIDRHLVQGAYLDVDLNTGTVRRLHPAAAHPMIVRLGEYFVLCTDFRDDSGKPINIDFYMARRDKTYVVFRADVDNRGPLKRLMGAGKAERLD